MNTIAKSSFFVLFALVVGLVAATPTALADHSEVVIEPVMGSSVAGCQDEPEGCYIPLVATVDVGGKVIFSNTDNVAHTFTSGTSQGGPDGIFDSGLALAGSNFEYEATEVGVIEHFCIVHPWMTGTIIVQEAAGMEMKDQDGMEMKYMDDPSATGMLSDGTMVSVWSMEPTMGEMLDVTVKFDGEHVNYDLMVMQGGNEILHDDGVHTHDGKYTHTTPMLDSDDAIDVTITFQGYGVDAPYTGPVGEMVTFTNIVPEFGTIAMMILVVAIISIIAVTAKSRVVPRL